MEKQNNIPKLRFPEFSDSWELKKLGEVAKFSKGKGISKADISENGETECIRYGELYTVYRETINEIKSRTNIDIKDLVLSEANDVIIPASGETQIDIATASCVLKSGIALGGDLNIIKTNNNGVFLSYLLNSAKKQDIANLAQGISVVHLYSSQLATLKISCPPLAEQQKIATFLSTIDEKLQTLKKKKSLLETYKKGVMQKLFSQEIRFKDDEENDFDNWEVKKLGETCEIIGGGTPDTINPEYWNGNIQWFTPTEIKSDYVSKSIRTITELGLQKSSAKKLSIGTILLTTRATIGEASIALEECTTNQGFQSLIVKEGINNLFVFNWIKENKHELTTRANGSTFPEISKTEIEKIQIPIPSFQEQTKIANFLTAIDKKINNVDKQINQAELWKKGLLQQMFV